MTRPDYCPVAQEPCQAMCSMSDVRCKIRDARLQPKREWVGLTPEDWDYIKKNCGSIRSAIKTAEALLKEKNT